MRLFRLLLLAGCVLGTGPAAPAADSAKPLTSFKGGDEVNALAFAPDGKMLVLGGGVADERAPGVMMMWDVAAGKAGKVTPRFAHTVNAVAVSPDGKLVAAGTNATLQGAPNNPFRVVPGDLKLFDAAGKETAVLRSPSLDYWSVAFSPDGKALASASSDIDGKGKRTPTAVVRLWDVAKGKETATLQGHKGMIRAVAWSPDGTLLATASLEPALTPNNPPRGELKLWDVATGKEKASLQGHAGGIPCVAFSPDGALLASGAQDGTVRLWDPSTAKEVAVLKGHAPGVTALAFSPDGKLLAAGSGDRGVHRTPGEVKVWDVAKRAEKVTLKGYEDTVAAVAFDPKGKLLAAAGSDGTVMLWDAAALSKP